MAPDASPFAGRRSVLLCTLTVLCAGCNQDAAPKGQVVALVNGTEVTVAELNEEARARGLPIGHDPALKAALIGELVDRKLLVEEARDRGFDRQPRYLLAKHRSDEILLAQQMLAAGAEQGAVSDEELKRYIAANPAAFAGRAQVSVEQLTVGGSAPPALRQALARAPTIAAMEQLIRAARLPSTRTSEAVDSANALDPRSKALFGLRQGDVFVVPRPGGLIAGKVVSVAPQPVPADQHLRVARERLQQQRTQAVFDRTLQQLRPKAQVQYQPGFAPPSPVPGT